MYSITRVRCFQHMLHMSCSITTYCCYMAMWRNQYAKQLSWDGLPTMFNRYSNLDRASVTCIHKRWLSTTVPLCWCSCLGWLLCRVVFEYFVPICQVFALWYVTLTNGLHCLQLQVLYVFKVAFLQRCRLCQDACHQHIFTAQSGSEMSYGNQGVVLNLCSHLSYFNTVCLARDCYHND